MAEKPEKPEHYKPEKIPWIEEHVAWVNPPAKIRVYDLSTNVQLGPPPFYRVDMKKFSHGNEEPYRWIPLADEDGKPVLYWTLDEAIEIGMPLAEEYMESEDWDNIEA